MPLSPLLLVHISCAVIGLLSGFLAMFLRKGSSRHRIAGNIFFASMMTMSASAIVIATVFRPVMLNAVAGSLTFYLVVTGWWAAKRRDGVVSGFDVGAFLFIVAVGLAALIFGAGVAKSIDHVHIAPAAYFVFGFVALLFAFGDVRMFKRGGALGTRRIARHLLRVSFALLIATLSFYPGQAKLFSTALRGTNLLWVPHIVLIGSMTYWTVRTLRRKRAQQASAEIPFETAERRIA